MKNNMQDQAEIDCIRDCMAWERFMAKLLDRSVRDLSPRTVSAGSDSQKVAAGLFIRGMK